jgi:hypothetical protein
MSSELDDLIAQGYVFRNEVGFTGLESAGVAYVGVTTGEKDVVVLGRSYSSSESMLTVELFEATYTGGTPARTLNRRLSSTRPAPASFMAGVTPGTLGSVITGVTLRAATSTGSAALSVSGDESKLYLKAGTQYVVRITNGGSNSANIGAAFDVRQVVGGISLEN